MAQKNYRKLIVLQNERSTHLEKKVNELSGWQFFRTLYNSDMLRTLGLNLLMILFFVPAGYVIIRNWMDMTAIGASLPIANNVGVGIAPWFGAQEFLNNYTANANNTMFLWLIPALGVFSVAIAGSFAVIRDAFWVGRVKVWKTFWKSVASSALIIAPCLCLLSATIFGVFTLTSLLAGLAIPSWIAVVASIIMWIAVGLFALYLFIFFAVVTVYKQPVQISLKSAWHLTTMNIVANIIKLLIAFLPVLGLFVLSGFFFTMLLSLIVLLGFYYIALVWMHHMMKTFSLFNPVVKKRIN